MDASSRILISGATGFVGHYLRTAIAARWPGAQVLGMAGREAEIAEGLVCADLLDRERIEAVVAAFRPDVVVHLAAQASVASSLRDQGHTWAVNLSGTLNLATALGAHVPEAVLLFSSSAEVYGAAFLAGMARESTVPQPMTPYAKSKALAERMLAEMLPASSRLVVARPFNHTGPGQSTSFVLPSFVEQIAQMEHGRRPPPPRGRQSGRLARVSRRARRRRRLHPADRGRAAAAGAVHLQHRDRSAAASLGQGRAPARSSSEVDFDIVVDPQRVRPVDLPSASGDPSLLHLVTGWTPKIAFDTTLVDLLEAARASERAKVVG